MTVRPTIFSIFLITALFLYPIIGSAKFPLPLFKTLQKDVQKSSSIAKNITLKGKNAALFANKAELSKKIDIPENMLLNPALRKMAVVGNEISETSPFAKKLLTDSKMPHEIINQYHWYGKKEYLNMSESVTDTMKAVNKTQVSSGLSTLSSKYKGLNRVVNEFNKGTYDSDIMVRTIRTTGKAGIRVFKWAAEHPKTTLAAMAITWYSYDPEGFETALNTVGGNIGGLIGETSIAVAAGAGKGFAEGAQKQFQSSSFQSIAIGVGLILLIALLFVKTFRRILLFPFKLLGLKAESKMNQMERQDASKQENKEFLKSGRQETTPPKSYL